MAPEVGTFHLIDLMSQAEAVQALLLGQPAVEKLAWLAAQGTLTAVPRSDDGAQQAYAFESAAGLRCLFFVDGDTLVFVGDNTARSVRGSDRDTLPHALGYEGVRPTAKAARLVPSPGTLAACAVGAVLGAMLWALSPLLAGQPEAWDAPYYYMFVLLGGGLLAACVAPRSFWAVPVGVYVGQLAYVTLAGAAGWLPGGGLWVVAGAVLGLGSAGIALAGAAVTYFAANLSQRYLRPA